MSHPATTSRHRTASDAGPAALSVEGLAKAFGDVRVLSAVDLQVAPGECVAVLGRSGCGKSTLLRIVAGLESADAGRVTVAGRTTDTPRSVVPPERRGVALVFQDLALWPHMTVAESLDFVARAARTRGRTEGPDPSRAAAAVGLSEELLRRRPGRLSGGERQRAALARALVQAPHLLLLDEPLTGLDRHLRLRLLETLAAARLEQGIATLLVTHDHEEAFSLADRVAIMREGRIVQVGPPEELYREPVDRFVAEFVGAASCLDASWGTGGLETPLGVLEPGAVLGRGDRTGRGTAVFRPEHVRADEPDALPDACRGQVSNSLYRGGSWLHRIALEGGEHVLARGSHRLSHGHAVGLVADAATFLPDSSR